MTTKLPWPYLSRPRYEVPRPETSEFEVTRLSRSENLLPKNEKPFCRGWIIRMMMNSSEKRQSKRWGAGRGRFLGFGLVSFIHLTVIAGLSLGLVWSGLGFLNIPVWESGSGVPHNTVQRKDTVKNAYKLNCSSSMSDLKSCQSQKLCSLTYLFWLQFSSSVNLSQSCHFCQLSSHFCVLPAWLRLFENFFIFRNLVIAGPGVVLGLCFHWGLAVCLLISGWFFGFLALPRPPSGLASFFGGFLNVISARLGASDCHLKPLSKRRWMGPGCDRLRDGAKWLCLGLGS